MRQNIFLDISPNTGSLQFFFNDCIVTLICVTLNVMKYL